MSTRFLSKNFCEFCGGTGRRFDLDKINRVIKELGLNDKTLAAKLGITAAYVSYLRSGKRRWTPDLAAKLNEVTEELLKQKK